MLNIDGYRTDRSSIQTALDDGNSVMILVNGSGHWTTVVKEDGKYKLKDSALEQWNDKSRFTRVYDSLDQLITCANHSVSDSFVIYRNEKVREKNR